MLAAGSTGWPRRRCSERSARSTTPGFCWSRSSADRPGLANRARPGRRAVRAAASRDLGVHPDPGAGLVAFAEPELELQVALPGQVLQAVPLDMLRIGEADRPQPLPGQPLVDLVKMVADQLLLGVGDLALVRFARVLAGRVVEAVPARAVAR